MHFSDKLKWWLLVPLLALAVFGFYWLGYETPRTDHLILFSVFGALILLCILIYRLLPRKDWWILFSIGLGFRLVLLFATPSLSDDFYRFTWDGELLRDGYNVFAFVPDEYKENVSGDNQEKYDELLHAHSDAFPRGMNSKHYYSVYPAVNQWIFYSGTFVGSPNNGNLVLLRVWMLIAEVVSFFLLRALLRRQNRESLIAVYWWHPFVILELVGNLHFEGIAITFILATLYYAYKNKWFQTAVMASLAIMTKLTPIFLLGALFLQFHWKKWLLTSVVSVLLAVLFFRTIVDFETLSNFGESTDLFFNLFAFNSATYYGLLEIATKYHWHEPRETVAGILPYFSIILGAAVVFLQKRSMEWTLLLLFTIYFFFSPIVHPWYITILIPLAVLTRTIYTLVWSVLIFGTYVSYGETYEIPEGWIYLEYGVVFLLAIIEMIPSWKLVNRKNTFLYPA